MQLTKKDQELLAWIGKMGYVSCEQVKKKTGVGRRAAYWRLHRLVENNYLRHMFYRRYEAGIYAPNVCTESRNILLSPQRKISPFNVRHNLMVVDVSLVLSKKGEWISDREFAALKKMDGIEEFHCPDGILETGDKKIAIEVELLQKSKSRLEKILRAHNRSEDYEEVWYLVPDRKMLERMQKLCRGYDSVKIFELEKVLAGDIGGGDESAA